MKKLIVKYCGECPLNTWNITKKDELLDIWVCCRQKPDHDVSYDIGIHESTCIVTKDNVKDYNFGIPRNCPLEDDNTNFISDILYKFNEL
jgi:hypothetical protein